MKAADRFVIVWGEFSLGSQLGWYFSSYVDISDVQMLTMLTVPTFFCAYESFLNLSEASDVYVF